MKKIVSPRYITTAQLDDLLETTWISYMYSESMINIDKEMTRIKRLKDR